MPMRACLRASQQQTELGHATCAADQAHGIVAQPPTPEIYLSPSAFPSHIFGDEYMLFSPHSPPQANQKKWVLWKKRVPETSSKGEREVKFLLVIF
jgi:hypothetical protein